MKCFSQHEVYIAIGPTSPTRIWDEKQEELQHYSLEKYDLKHSKLGKIKRQTNIVQMKE